MDKMASWIGLGVKGGGTLGFVGLETMEGVVSNIGYPQHSHSLNVSSIRLGAGLGGGAGLVAIMIFNCPNLMNLSGTQSLDWSLNLALGAKWDGVVKGLKTYKFFATVARIGGKLINATPADTDNIRNAMSYLYSTYDMVGMSGPKLVSIDIPFAGIGAEVSLHLLDGTLTLGDLVMANRTTEPAPTGVRRGSM